VKTVPRIEEALTENSEQICSHLMNSISKNADLVSIVAKQMGFHTEIENYYTDQQQIPKTQINLLLRTDHLEIVTEAATKLK